MRLRTILVHSAAAIVLALFVATQALAQGGERFSFDDIPVDDARQYYVAVGGGYLGMLGFMNFDKLNEIGDRFGLPPFEGQLFLNGGGGLISLLIVPNVRLGVYGLGGSRVIQSDVTLPEGKFRRSLRFGTSMTGAQFDYAIRLFRSVTILPGIMLGAGTYNLEYTQSQADSVGFNQIFGTDPGLNRSSRISSSHFFYYPAVNLEWAITQFVMLRAGVGYRGTAAESNWTDGSDTQVTGVSDLNANGLTLQFGVFVGLFQNQ